MSRRSITIGEIFSLLGLLAFIILVISILANPLSPDNIEKITTKTVESSIPLYVEVLIALAPYGVIGVILIIIVIIFWDKIMNQKIPI